jgi:aspartate-semialdehyde dehydrogenase
MKLAIVGATGMVGTKMLQVIKERKLPYNELYLVASKKSAGKVVEFNGEKYTVLSIEEALDIKMDIALFSAGGETSKMWAPKFASQGTVVIDNSSAWRMDLDKKLIVPEVNGHLIDKNDLIIANPNCSTIQLVVVLNELQKVNPIQRVVVSTYQSITGTGVKAVEQMENERNGISSEMIYPYPIDKNLIPHIDTFLENGYTKEEQKIIDESKKILNLPDLAITSTAVRVPVMGGHSESVNIEFENEIDLNAFIQVLKNADGVKFFDNLDNLEYPMPILSEDNDYVWIGRVRKDNSHPKAINMWIVSDNLRKGAATNAVQIAEIVTSLKQL